MGTRYRIPHQALKDVDWWRMALQVFPGKALMWNEKFQTPDAVVAADACMVGAGGTFTPECSERPVEYYRCRFPAHITEGATIAHLELWALIITLKIWGDKLSGKVVISYCDNEAVANLVNSGKARDAELQKGLREVCYIAAKFGFELQTRFLPGEQNRLPDLLSRWSKGQMYRDQFRKLVPNANRKPVRHSLFYYSHNW